MEVRAIYMGVQRRAPFLLVGGGCDLKTPTIMMITPATVIAIEVRTIFFF